MAHYSRRCGDKKLFGAVGSDLEPCPHTSSVSSPFFNGREQIYSGEKPAAIIPRAAPKHDGSLQNLRERSNWITSALGPITEWHRRKSQRAFRQKESDDGRERERGARGDVKAAHGQIGNSWALTLSVSAGWFLVAACDAFGCQRAHSDFCADLLGCCERTSERCWPNLWKLTLKGRRQKAPAARIPLMQIGQRETNPLKAFRLLKLLKILIEGARLKR